MVSVTTTNGESQRAHITELRLALRELHSIMESEAPRLDDAIRALLMQSSVKQKDIDSIRRVILRALDVTDGRAARDTLRNLRHTVEKVEWLGPTLTEAAHLVARDLVKEAKKRAKASGVPEEEVRRMEEAARRTIGE